MKKIVLKIAQFAYFLPENHAAGLVPRSRSIHSLTRFFEHALRLCGIDPQNLLQVDSAVLLHTRWVKLCGPGFTAEFISAAVQDRDAGTFTSVVGAADSVAAAAAAIRAEVPKYHRAMPISSTPAEVNNISGNRSISG